MRFVNVNDVRLVNVGRLKCLKEDDMKKAGG
jgi:hypothetical protein